MTATPILLSDNSSGVEAAAAAAADAVDAASPSPSFQFYAQNLLIAVVTLCTVAGNGFIILCIARHPSLQRPSHIFIASLASTDLLLGITVMVPRLVHELAGSWIFGFLLCQVYHAMDVTLCTSSILHLSCISLDRYYAIVNQPLLYNDRMTKKRVAGMILLCWLLSGLTGFVPVFTGIYSSAEHLDLIRKNSRDCGDLVVNKYFSVFAGIVSFWTPASIMVYVYFKVYRETKRLQRTTYSIRETKIVDLATTTKTTVMSTSTSSPVAQPFMPKSHQPKQNSHQLKQNSHQPKQNQTQVLALPAAANGVGVADGCNGGDGQERVRAQSVTSFLSTGAEERRRQQKHRERESSAARTVGIVMGIFVVCWTPFFIWMPLTALFELHTPPVIYSIILWIGYGNSTVNPFIYGFFCREFRSVILSDLRKVRVRQFVMESRNENATYGV